MQDLTRETRRAFGFLFLAVAIAIGTASVLSEIAHLAGLGVYYHAAIWLGTFGAVFGVSAGKFKRVAPSIRDRMKKSTSWSIGSKIVNAISWAGPFAAIAAFPSLYQYLMLLGIGLGNLSTFIFLKRFSGSENIEQLVVAVISIAALPAAFAIDSSLFATQQDIAIMLSRLLIAVAYGAGGAFALLRS